MSPQILKRQQYTAKCDIWSLGLILYELLFGVTPWHSQNLIELISKIETKVGFPNSSCALFSISLSLFHSTFKFLRERKNCSRAALSCLRAGDSHLINC